MMPYWVCPSPPLVFAWLAGLPVQGACEAVLESVQPRFLVDAWDYPPLLGMTLAIEVPLWVGWCGVVYVTRNGRLRESRRGLGHTLERASRWALAANLVSHPLFVFLWLRQTSAWGWSLGLQLGMGEILVVVVEALL